ncbi:MAG: asparaginase [Acidobacteriota bacterium]
MTNDKKRIAIYFTGGTISMKIDPTLGAAVPALSGKEIIGNVPEIAIEAEAEIIDFGRYPGPHWTLPLMWELAKQVQSTLSRPEVDGVVVTHGTDSLEETSFFLDLTIHSEKPVVFVGAMRNSSEAAWDGPPNLLSAVRVALSDAARGKGVMVVMNDTIVAASEATKTHTESIDAFQGLDFGCLGVVDKGEVIFRRTILNRQPLNAGFVVEPVFLIKVAAGVDSTLIHAAIDAGAKGLVIEAMGRGNVPPACVDGIQRAIEQNIPVVLTSRCPRGRVYDSYGYEGAGKQLRRMGVIFADFLNAQKARIKLALALSMTGEVNGIRKLFEQ